MSVIATVGLSCTAAMLWGVSNFLTGRASRTLNGRWITFAGSAVGVVVIAPVALVVPGRIDAPALGWAALAAIAGTGGFVAMFTATASGQLSLVTPLIAGSAAVVSVGAGVVTGDRPTAWTALGILTIIVAVVLVSLGRARAAGGDPAAAPGAGAATPDGPVTTTTGRSIRLAVGSGALLGLGIAALGQTTAADGLPPLLLYRLVIVVAVAGILAYRRELAGTGVAHWRPLVVPAVLGTIGDIAFIIALQGGDLSVAAVVGSLHPVTTVLLARWVSGELIRSVQFVGIALALGGIVLVRLGAG